MAKELSRPPLRKLGRVFLSQYPPTSFILNVKPFTWQDSIYHGKPQLPGSSRSSSDIIIYRFEIMLTWLFPDQGEVSPP